MAENIILNGKTVGYDNAIPIRKTNAKKTFFLWDSGCLRVLTFDFILIF